MKIKENEMHQKTEECQRAMKKQTNTKQHKYIQTVYQNNHVTQNTASYESALSSLR